MTVAISALILLIFSKTSWHKDRKDAYLILEEAKFYEINRV